MKSDLKIFIINFDGKESFVYQHRLFCWVFYIFIIHVTYLAHKINEGYRSTIGFRDLLGLLLAIFAIHMNTNKVCSFSVALSAVMRQVEGTMVTTCLKEKL